MQLKTTNKQIVKEVPWGVWVWEMPDGEVVGNEDGFMLVFATEDSRAAVKAITDAAKSYGITEGKPVFWTGKRPISDDEYEEQLSRHKFGLTPDPLDLPSLKEDLKYRDND